MVAPITVWTPEMDAELAAFALGSTGTATARAMGLRVDTVWKRAKGLNIQFITNKARLTPSKEVWIAAATEKAHEARVRPWKVMSGGRGPRAVIARRMAWKAVLDGNPCYSIAGLARVSGFDHTTILHGLRRLSGCSSDEARDMRGSGRRPAPAVAVRAG